MTKFIGYYRVSTKEQQLSGLGLEAQQETVKQHVKHSKGKLIAEFQDVASGSCNKRIELQKAIRRCELSGATLLIARLDRLSRNAYFLTKIANSNIKFICCDMPSADKLTLHILAGVAEKEAQLISERTKQALARAKANGVLLGNRTNLDEVRNKDVTNATKFRVDKSKNYYENLLKDIDGIPDHDSYSTRALAQKLTDLGITSPRGTAITASIISKARRMKI